MYCANCKNTCGVMKYDDSFNHESGIEERHHYGSDCCDADVYKHLCSKCFGYGTEMTVKSFKSEDTIIACDECDGLGVLDEVDILELFKLFEDDRDWDTIAKENREYDRGSMERVEDGQ